MTSPTEKFDRDLRKLYNDYLRQLSGDTDLGPAGAEPLELSEAYFVMVQHTGDIAGLEASGLFNAAALGDNLASGEIRLQDLDDLAGNPDVVSIEAGAEQDPLLETSVPEIKADQVWTLNRSNGQFTGAGETGENVVIGIIDTGIDVTHPDFLKTATPTKTTRIQFVWDQGLDPVGSKSSPARSLLAPSTTATYGVQFTAGNINTEIQGGAAIRHSDCNGHGTHVASIACGGGTADGTPLRNVGVAPKADIVAVKIFYPVKDNPPPFSQRFIDAVHYIENIVATELGGRPVVINYSGGSSTGPHDGLTASEIFLTNRYRGATGKAFVTSCGNNANKRAHAFITIPSGGTVDVPFRLFDNRRLKTDTNRCARKSNTRSGLVDVWYPDVAGVSVKVKLATESSFRATAVGRGDPDFSGTFDGGKSFELSHSSSNAVRPAEPGAVPPIASSTIHRSNFWLEVKAAGDDHATGGYVLRIAGPAGTELHAWCDSGDRQGFQVGPTLPSGVTVRDVAELIGGPAGARHVISVAAYNDVGGAIASFSSRGMLVDYSGVANLAEKPDLGAPGVQVTAADSSTNVDEVFRGMFAFGNYTRKSGTSMSSPHVAGAVALMLQKRPTLTRAQIETVLTTAGQGARATPPPKDFGAGKLDAKGAVDNVP